MPATPDYELLLAAGCADCPVCGRPGSVVAPDGCADGHGADCPDRMCLSCGSALALGPAFAPAHSVRPRRRAARRRPARTA